MKYFTEILIYKMTKVLIRSYQDLLRNLGLWSSCQFTSNFERNVRILYVLSRCIKFRLSEQNWIMFVFVFDSALCATTVSHQCSPIGHRWTKVTEWTTADRPSANQRPSWECLNFSHPKTWPVLNWTTKAVCICHWYFKTICGNFPLGLECSTTTQNSSKILLSTPNAHRAR